MKYPDYDPIKSVSDIRELTSKVTGTGRGSKKFKIALVALANLNNNRESLENAIIAFEDLRDTTE